MSTTYYASRVGCETCTGLSPAEAGWRFFAHNPRKNLVDIDRWDAKPDGTSEHAGRERLSRGDVRRLFNGGHSPCKS